MMNKHIPGSMRLFGRGAAILLAALWLPGAAAEITNCTPITSLPNVITTQGIYCFTGHLSTAMTTGYAIEIQTNNVTIDLNGYKLGDLAAGDGTQAIGIYANQRKNIVIRNGSIRGFHRGIWLYDVSPYTNSQGHLVEDVLADNNTFIGLQVNGRGNTLRNNLVVDTSGSTVNADAYGLVVTGPGNEIINNRVTTTTSNGSGKSYGIYVSNGAGSVVVANRVLDTTSAGGSTYGAYFILSDYLTAKENIITTADYGLYYTGSSGKYMGNLTNNIATASFSGGTAVGTNN